MTMWKARRLVACVAMFAVLPLGITVWAQRGSRGAARSSVSRSSSASVNRNVDVNRNVNANRNVDVNRNVNANRNVDVNRNVGVNRNIDVDRDIDVDHRYGGGYGCCYHPVARTAAAVTTAAVIGSMVYSLPSSCQEINVNGLTYQQCGSTWYQPQFSGSSVTYIVVNPPH
jgi:hypothetical protein